MRRVYLDYNATAPLRPEAREAMLRAMDAVGNPSSVHSEGRAAKAIVEKARGQVAALVGCDPAEVVFTSGATEAAATILKLSWVEVGCADTEHDCVINNIAPLFKVMDADDVEVSSRFALPIDKNGKIKDLIASELQKSRITICSPKLNWPSELNAVCAANGEVGIINDVSRFFFGETSNTLLCDITQFLGKRAVPENFHYRHQNEYPFVHYMICSAHKLGGPKGVGAIINKLQVATDVSMIKGGGQEMGRRSGTENVIGIAGFGAAAEAAARDLETGVWDKVAKLRNILESAIEDGSDDTIFVGRGVERLPNTSCFITPGWKGETQVMQMDLAGFAISAGSACSSGKVKSSRVLRAMGYDDDLASSAVRVSLGPETTEDEVMAFADAWLKARQKQRARAA